MAKWQPKLGGKLPPVAVGEITRLVENAADLEALLMGANENPSASSPDIVLRSLSKRMKISFSDLRKIFNALENIRIYKDDFGSFDLALDRLKNGIDGELLANFEANRHLLLNAIQKYSQDNSVMLSYKAARLIFQRSKLFQEGEIVTDVRPIFDSAGSELKQMVITHELVISYYEGMELHKDFIALDNADILKLRKSCERAILKSRTLKNVLKDTCAAEVLNDETDAVG